MDKRVLVPSYIFKQPLYCFLIFFWNRPLPEECFYTQVIDRPIWIDSKREDNDMSLWFYFFRKSLAR